MTSRARRSLIITASVGVLILIAALTLPRVLSRHRSLVDALADALQLSPERRDFFFVNLPPAAARYPGSVLIPSQSLVLERSDLNDKDIITGSKFRLECDDASAADAVGSLNTDFSKELIENKQSLKLRMTVEDGRVLEMTIDNLKHRLLDSTTVQSASNKGADPVVVTRSYLGKVTIEVRKGANLDGTAWAALKGDLAKTESQSDSAKIEAHGSNDDSLEFSIAEPIVFAYEVSRVSYITNNLSAQPDDVKLTPVKRIIQGTPTSALPTSQPSTRWVLATIASGHYPNLKTLEQDWNATSADVIRNTLSLYHPAKSLALTSSPSSPLTEDKVTDFLEQIDKSVAKSQSKAVLVYYIGHVVTWPNGDIALLLGDAEDTPKPEGAGPTATEVKANVGEQVGNLYQLAKAIQANVEQLPRGYLPLRTVYEKLASIKVPFALIIDGCFRNSDFEKQREALGFAVGQDTRDFMFVGDGSVNRPLSDFGSLLQHFADSQPYLRGDNPVLFATKPGTAAFARSNPDWELGRPVGPLAYRISNYVKADVLTSEAPSLPRLLRNVTDMNGVGEIESRGSISWSDFSRFESATQNVLPSIQN